MPTTTVEKLSPTRAKLTISVTPEELKPSITHAYEPHRRGHQHPRLPQGQGSAAPSSTSASARPPCSSTPSTRASTASTARPSPSTSCARWAARRPTSSSGRATRTSPATCSLAIEVDVRPEIDAPRPTTASTVTVDAVEVADDEVDEELDNLRSRFGTLITVDRPAKTGDFVEHRPGRHDRRRRGRHAPSGISYEVGSGELHRGHRRGARLAHRRRDHHLRAPSCSAATTRARPPRSPSPSPPSRSASFPRPTTTSLRSPASSTPSPSCARASSSRSRPARPSPRAARPATSSSSKLLELVEVPVPAALIEDEVHRHLEGESRLEDDEHRAEVTESSEKTVPHADPARHDRRGRRGQGQPGRAHPVPHPGRRAVRHGPERVRPGPAAERPDPGDGRRGRPQQGARDRPRQGRRRHQRQARRPVRVRRR